MQSLPMLINYFEDNYSKNIIDHSLRIYKNSNGDLMFYIHPDGKDGNTVDVAIRSLLATPKVEVKLPEKRICSLHKNRDAEYCSLCELNNICNGIIDEVARLNGKEGEK